jgi:hypothetical protein
MNDILELFFGKIAEEEKQYACSRIIYTTENSMWAMFSA